MRQIILDTETTGLDPDQGHRVIEIACVEIISRQASEANKRFYLNPDRESDPEALAIHGLSTDFLSDKPRFAEIVDTFLDFIRDSELIIHNAPFDIKFLNAELARVNRAPIEECCPIITDSLIYARTLHPGKRNSLNALCDRYGISNAHRTLHGALLDAELLADVWLAMTRGQDVLPMNWSDHPAMAGENNGVVASFDNARLLVLKANEQEQAAHAAYLLELDKLSPTGVSVWRSLYPA